MIEARVLRFTAPFRVELERTDVEEPGPGQVLVRTEYSGISSGTEMLAYRGELDPAMARDETLGAFGGTFRYPFAYGYSAVGTVEAGGAGLAAGTRVFAFNPHQDVFAAFGPDVVRLPAEMPARIATLLPLAETALQVTLEAGTQLGDTAVVSGLGPIGILTAATLARTGAGVLGSDPLAWRREAARAFGIEALHPRELAAGLRERAPEGRADVLVEASGNPAALAEGLGLLAHEGLALVCSWYGTKPVTLPLGADFHRRRLRIQSTQVSSIPSALAGRWTRERRRQAALSILGELPASVLATHEFPLERAAEAYEAIEGATQGLIHVALAHR